MNATKAKSSLMLLLTAAIWGTAFVAQSVGMEYIGPFTFNAVRSIIGGLVLIPCIFLLDHLRGTPPTPQQAGSRKTLLWGGSICGVILCIASNLQQFGIQYTTVGKAGFITAFYIVLVPIIGLFLKKKCSGITWVGVAIALAGLYLLCINEKLSVGTGDLLVLLGSLLFAVHILVIDHFSPLVDGVRMSCIQFFVCGILSAVMMFLCESPQPAQIAAAWLPLLYAGVLSCGVAYTLQVVWQKGLNPTVASLILSLESVISVLAGWVLLRQQLSSRELLGCLLMFCAIILVECAPPPRKKAAQLSADAALHTQK